MFKTFCILSENTTFAITKQSFKATPAQSILMTPDDPNATNDPDDPDIPDDPDSPKTPMTTINLKTHITTMTTNPKMQRHH